MKHLTELAQDTLLELFRGLQASLLPVEIVLVQDNGDIIFDGFIVFMF